MHYCLTFRQYLHVCFMQVFMPYWNFDYTKAVTLYTVVKVGGNVDPATEVRNPFWVKSTSNFLLCSDSISLLEVHINKL